MPRCFACKCEPAQKVSVKNGADLFKLAETLNMKGMHKFSKFFSNTPIITLPLCANHRQEAFKAELAFIEHEDNDKT